MRDVRTGEIGFSAPSPTKGLSHAGPFCARAAAFLQEEDGPTAVEYAVMMALIIVACIATLTTLGSNANNTFSYVATKATKTAS